MKTVILHHGSCPDGFGAAWWLQHCLTLTGTSSSEIELVPMQWHERPPLERCDGAQVWSVDYCPDAKWLIALDGMTDMLTVLDHHQSSLAEPPKAGFEIHDLETFMSLTELSGLNQTEIVIDQNYSGVGLVVRMAFRSWGIDSPEFLWCIEDRDLWRFHRPDTADVTAAVNARPYTIEAWDALSVTDMSVLRAEGAAINTYREQMIEAVSSSYVWIALRSPEDPDPSAEPGTWAVPCSVSPYMIGSDVAGRLAERDVDGLGIGAYCILHPEHVQFGLRSRGNGPDVAKIAELYGGGGHEHASGFEVDYATFANMICAE